MRLALLALAFLLMAHQGHAAVLFSDSFDSQTDWQPSPGTDDESTAGAVAECNEGDCSASVPTGWSYYRTDGWWWAPTYKDTVRVTGDFYRGASGKAYTQWTEGNAGASGDGWGADGILAKYFTTDYQEIYASIWLYVPSDWQWAGQTEDILKIFRISHYDGSGSCFAFFSSGNQAPLYQFYIKQTADYGFRRMHGFRCDPQEDDYYCPDGSSIDAQYSGSFGDSGNYGDGDWHKITIRLKMNTYAGSGSWNSDGIMQYWHDGVLMDSVTDKKWITSGTDDTIGWNFVGIAGNAYNNYSADSNHAEQRYSIDDICVATTEADLDSCTTSTPSGGSSVIGGNSSGVFGGMSLFKIN